MERTPTSDPAIDWGVGRGRRRHVGSRCPGAPRGPGPGRNLPRASIDPFTHPRREKKKLRRRILLSPRVSFLASCRKKARSPGIRSESWSRDGVRPPE